MAPAGELGQTPWTLDQHLSANKKRSTTCRGAIYLKMPPAGIEPASQPPQGYALSGELRGQARVFASGEAGIRTPGEVNPTVVFKTTAIVHSAIPPGSRDFPTPRGVYHAG